MRIRTVNNRRRGKSSNQIRKINSKKRHNHPKISVAKPTLFCYSGLTSVPVRAVVHGSSRKFRSRAEYLPKRYVLNIIAHIFPNVNTLGKIVEQ